MEPTRIPTQLLPIKAFLLPAWLDDVLEALNKPLSILNDAEGLRRILSDTDVEFYHQNLDELLDSNGNLPELLSIIFESMEQSNIMYEIEGVSYNPSSSSILNINRKTDSLYGTCQLNSANFTQLKPFIKYGNQIADSVNPRLGCVRPVFRYISDQVVVISFEHSEVDITADELLEGLIGFLVSRFGLKEVARTPIFKSYVALI